MGNPQKEFFTRIQHKHDTEVNWNKATNFIPLQGEIIIYDIDNNYGYERMKIGDGVSKVNDLLFADDNKMNKINPSGSGSFSLNRTANSTIGDYSTAIGYNNIASGYAAYAEGVRTTAEGYSSHAEGHYTFTQGDYSHAEGTGTCAYGSSSHAEGTETHAGGDYSHAEGTKTNAGGDYSHAEGMRTGAEGDYSHAEGLEVIAYGSSSHAEGTETHAGGDYSHAEGMRTGAEGEASHAEGNSTTALGDCSHAEGMSTEALGDCSHAEGEGTVAGGNCSHVQGKYNLMDANNKFAHIVGNGTSTSARSNAHTLDWDGNAWFKGDIYIGGASQDDTNATKVLTEDRLSDLGAITIDLEGSTEGAIAGIDADTFQGYSIDRFVMYNVGGGDGEDIPTIEATSGVSIDLESAEESGQPVTIDADILGGYPPEYYATKTEVETAQTTANNAIARLDDMGMDLLWQNASPNSGFAPQKINNNNKPYNTFQIDLIVDKDNPKSLSFIVGKGFSELYTVIYSGNDIHHRRREVTITDDGFTFSTGYQNGGKFDWVMIPIKIQGIK